MKTCPYLVDQTSRGKREQRDEHCERGRKYNCDQIQKNKSAPSTLDLNSTVLFPFYPQGTMCIFEATVSTVAATLLFPL